MQHPRSLAPSAGTHQLLGRTLGDDAPTGVAAAGAEIDDPDQPPKGYLDVDVLQVVQVGALDLNRGFGPAGAPVLKQGMAEGVGQA